MNRSVLASSGLGALLLLAAACAPKIPNDPPPHALVARFDPTTSKVPLPTDLVKNPETGKLDVPLGTSTGAQRELFGFLGTQSAWPASSTAEVSFGDLADPNDGGFVSAASVTSATVVAYDVTTGQELDVIRTVIAPGNKITIEPDGGLWPKGHTLLFAVRGNEAGVKGENGLEVDAEAAFHFLRNRVDISEHAEVIPGATEEERQSNANRLEGVRQSFQPLFELLERHDLPREDVAVLWSFTVESPRAELLYDPTISAVPLPNDLIRDPSGKVAAPIKADEDPARAAVLRDLNTLYGFSTSGTLTFQTTEPVDPASLAAAVKVYELSGDTLTPYPDVRVRVASFSDDAGTIQEAAARRVVIEPHAADASVQGDPRTPFKQEQTYVVVVEDSLRQLDGGAFSSQIFAQLLKFKEPFIDEDGKSTVSVLGDEDARTVERARAQLEPAFDDLERRGLPRQRVLTAFAFTTLPIFKEMRALADFPWKADAGLTLGPATSVVRPTVLTMPGITTAMLNSTVVTGTLTTTERLDPRTRKFFTDGGYREVQLGYRLCVPANQNANTPVPVILLAHEITMSKDLGLSLCDDFAAQGYATLSIDMPYHGARTVCVRKPEPESPDVHCAAGSTCSEDGVCRTDAGVVTPIDTRASTIETQAWAQNFAQPVDDAQTSAFLESDLFAIRDHYNQAVIDLAAVQRSLILGRDQWRSRSGFTLDGNDTVVLGYGVVGGVVAGTFVAAEPRVKAADLHLTGCGLISLLQDSTDISAQLRPKLALRGIERGNAAHFEFEFAGRWALDQADCANHLPFLEPYEYVDLADGATKTARARKVAVQAASADTVIPVPSAQLAARLALVPLTIYATTAAQTKGGHGTALDPTNLNRAAVRADITNFFDTRNAP